MRTAGVALATFPLEDEGALFPVALTGVGDVETVRTTTRSITRGGTRCGSTAGVTGRVSTVRIAVRQCVMLVVPELTRSRTRSSGVVKATISVRDRRRRMVE